MRFHTVCNDANVLELESHLQQLAKECKQLKDIVSSFLNDVIANADREKVELQVDQVALDQMSQQTTLV